MSKKVLYICFACLLTLTAIAGENPKLTRANKLYDKYAYKDAIVLYEELAAQNISYEHVANRLANSYRFINDMNNAEKWYAIVIGFQQKTSEDIFNYAEALQENKKEDDANKYFEMFAELSPNDSRAKQWKEGKKTLEVIKKDNQRFRINTLDINSEYADFGATFYGNKVVFASSRIWEFSSKHQHSWNNQPYLDLYEADKDDSYKLSNVIHFSNKVNSKLHDGPASFSQDGSQIYFTRNNFFKGHKTKSSDGVIKLEIFTSTKNKEGKWNNVTPFLFNNNEYSIGHPFVTEDGNTLFFSSDMPGGLGQSDIWYCTKNGDGSWSKPINCGATVNTEGKELFPFYSSNNMLFFASDGHVGLGGLDLFYSKFKTSAFTQSKNLGASINSSKDDFGFVINKNETKGYFCSNREGGKGDDDIYSFEMLKKFEVEYIINGLVVDKDDKTPLAGSIVTITDGAGNLKELKTDADGKYSLSVEPNKKYIVYATYTKYLENKLSISTVDLSEDAPSKNIVSELEKDLGFNLYGLISDKANNQPLKDVKVKIIDAKTKEVIIDIVTPESGDFSKVLADKKISDRLNYEISLSKDGYLNKNASFGTLLEKTGTIKLNEQLNITLEKIEVGMDLAKIIEIKPIYFDLGKFNIRGDAGKELDKIVKIMTEHPKMVVELGSHTDCRSSAASNLKLSTNRAKASVEYIISKGIERERITGKGYGESKLVNDCACEGAVKSKCSEDEHQMNRRTEFIILKME